MMRTEIVFFTRMPESQEDELACSVRVRDAARRAFIFVDTDQSPGVLGVHVEDLVGGGNLVFQKAVHWLRTEI